MADMWAPWVQRVSAVYLVMLRHLSALQWEWTASSLRPQVPSTVLWLPGSLWGLCGSSSPSPLLAVLTQRPSCCALWVTFPRAASGALEPP